MCQKLNEPIEANAVIKKSSERDQPYNTGHRSIRTTKAAWFTHPIDCTLLELNLFVFFFQ
jgi:hypothetical protein